MLLHSSPLDENPAVPIQIIHEEDDDGDDMGSDEEDYVIDNGLAGEDVFGFGDTFVNANNREGGGLFVQRRPDYFVPLDDNVQVFGRSRSNTAAPPEATTHPLLLDTSASNHRAPSHQPPGSRQPQRIIASGNAELLQTIDDLIGGGAVQLFHHIMSRGRGGGTETIRLDVPPGTVVNLERGYLQQRRGPQRVHSASVRVETPHDPHDDRVGRDLEPLLTSQRWAQEVKILHGEFVTERLGRFANFVILALLPAAVEAIKQAKIIEEQEIALQREAQAAADALAEEKAKSEQALPEAAQGAEEPQESNPIDAESTTEIPAVPLIVPDEAATFSPPPATTEQDHTMEDAVLIPVDNQGHMTDATMDVENQVPATASNAHDEASTSTLDIPGESSTTPPAVERVTVMIHGSAVDITETGIDPTFLEALPDDMREEVLNQHVRDQRAARVERPADSQISSEFLDALPPEIRAEIIQQEAVQRARVPARAPAEIDNASFIASLDPTLRQTVLMEQDEGFIQTLPSHMLAEVGAYREGQQTHRIARSGIRNVPLGSNTTRKPVPQHDAIQLLDKVGVAVLVRLLFFPHVLKKTLLFKVLVNLCENAKTRTELFNLLLSILQDGTGDLAAVDKSFAQMSFRNSKPLAPKSLGKQKAGPEYLTGLPLPNSQNEAVPDLIAQRCLEGLTYIVSSNELSSLFFLTEHELPAGLRRVVSKKGKGKEKQMPQTHFPIVLLLGLLDRQSLLGTPAIMESVVGLLATVTRPLASLKDHKKPEEPEASSSTAIAAPPSSPPEVPESNAVPMEISETAERSAPPSEPLPSTNEQLAPANEPTASKYILTDSLPRIC